jgi:hypothetical protein
MRSSSDLLVKASPSGAHYDVDITLLGDICRPMVSVVPNVRRWNVTIGGRIDGVTDDQGFPTLFESALTSDPKVKLVHFNQSTFPHTTSAVVLVSAVNKETAEAQGQDVLLRNLRIAARAIVGDNNFGWVTSASAAPITNERSLIHMLRHWLRRRSEIV